MNKIIVIGGGPAGMLASGFASQNEENEVILLEKNKKLGRKLFITGKGRCNVTNCSDAQNLIENVVGNPYFLYSAFYTFDSYKTMEFFESLGVQVKVERGNRVFPKSDKSSDIVKALNNFMKKNGVDIRLNSKVDDILFENDKIKYVIVNGEKIESDKVIIATGGLSYPMTGSDGDGYKFAKKMGHKVTKLYPSLVPINIKEDIFKSLQGLSLRNVTLGAYVDGKKIYDCFGEMLFTHFGITGPLVLKTSRNIIHKLDKKIIIKIDLKPALTNKQLDERLSRDFKKYINKAFKNSLDDILPQKLIPVIIILSGIDENKKVHSITKIERQKLLTIIKNLEMTVHSLRGYNEAVVTSGGIDTNYIDPSTMKSKIIDNLYFAGEVIDVDCYTGGFNLQTAFATAYLAGNNV